MTLKLALSVTLDSAGAVTGVQQIDKALDGVGDAARSTERDVRAMEAALARAANEAARAKQSAERAVGMQTIAPNRGADVAAYGREMDGLRAKFNPLFAAQRQYKATLDEIRMAQRTGALSAAEAAGAIERTKSSFAAQVGSINAARSSLAGHAAQSKLTAQQSQQLAYQLNDVAVSLAGGMNPLMVLMQQGSQITPLFGGIGGTMRALVGAINPVTAGLTGLAVVTASGALAWNSYLKSTLEAQTALSGLGRNSGATRREVEAIAQANAAAGNVTVSQARSIEAQLLRTGKVGVDSFGSVIRLTRDFAATINTDADTAAQKLADVLTDPAKGAAELFRQYGLLDGATVRYVERLQLLGREEEARKLILDRLPQQMASHREALTGWARLWDQVAKAADNAKDAIGRVVERRFNGETDQGRIETLERQLAAEKALEAKRQSGGVRGGFRSKQDEIERLEARLQIEKDYLKRSADAEKAEAERRRAEAQAQERADRALGVAKASPINDLMERRRQLKLEIDQLEKGLSGRLDLDPAEDASRRREINAAIEGKRAALEGLRPVQERQAELDRLDAAIAMARDPVTKAELAGLREKIALEGQEMSVRERSQAIENARMKVLLDASSSARGRAVDIRDEARARAAVNDAIAAGRVNISELDRFMRTEQELRPLIIAHAKAEGAAKKELATVIEQLRQASAASAREEARSGALQQIAGQKERLDTLRVEAALIGASEGTRARMLALLEAEQTIRRGNIDAGSAEARQIRENAAAQATLSAEIERQKAAYSSLRSFGERQIDAIIDKIGEQGLSWQSMGDLAKSMLGDLNKEMLKLAIGNPLKNMLTGGNLPTLSDAQGLLGSLFGQTNDGGGAASIISSIAGRSVGAMTVNAASVVINGGLTGQAGNALAGILGGTGGQGNLLSRTPALSDATGFLRTVAPGLRADAIPGLQPEFQRRMSAIIQDAQSQFGKSAVSIVSGFRSVDRQRELWSQALDKYGSADAARKWVAPPGHSQHNFGNAADLKYGSPAVKDWMQENAGNYGLKYRVPNEPWHLEMDKAATPTAALARSAEAANENLVAFTSTASSANAGLDKFGNSLQDLGRQAANSGGGGAVGGNWLSRLFGGSGSSSGTDPNVDANGVYMAGSRSGGLFHTGGMVGSGSGPSRSVPWEVFTGAPRYHVGGLLPGERPIIAKDGEGIFTPRQMDNADALIQAAMQPRVITMVSQPPSAAALSKAISTPVENSSQATRVTVINNGQPVSATKKEKTAPDGSRDITIVLDEMQAANAANVNAKTFQAIRRAHGTAPALTGRSR